MEALKGIEKLLVEQGGKLPFHLPAGVRKWLGDNLWWLVIVSLALTVLGVLSSLRALLWVDTLASTPYSALYPYKSVSTVPLWISLAGLVITGIIELRAIAPLRRKLKYGWDLMLLAALVSIGTSLVAGAVGGTLLGSLIGIIIGVAVSGFLLYEVRAEFIIGEAAKRRIATRRDV